jgi:hypothetical protein
MAQMCSQNRAPTRPHKEIIEMANEKELSELLGRALIDQELRATLMADPQGAATELGFDLTEEQVAGLKATDLNKLSEALDERLSKKLFR